MSKHYATVREKDVNELFDALDRDNSGTLTLKEILEGDEVMHMTTKVRPSPLAPPPHPSPRPPSPLFFSPVSPVSPPCSPLACLPR